MNSFFLEHFYCFVPCGDTAKERPTSIREARVQAPSKPEFFSGFFFCNFFNCSLPARINSLLITRRSKYDLFHILFVIKTSLRGRKDPLKFASLPTCGFVAQLVERPTSIREARVQAPSKPEFFFQASFSAISLIAVYLRGSIRYLSPAGLNMIYFIYYL